MLASLIFVGLFFLSVKPVSHSSGTIYFGAFVGTSHAPSPSKINAFETEVGKGLSIWNWFQYWNRLDDSENMAEFNPAWMDECRTHGSIPMVTWDPETGDPNDQFTNLGSIINGNEDKYITTWAQAAKAWGHPFFIRLMHEFNGAWTPYCEGVNGNTVGQFVQAWQHIVNIFNSIGATNVCWVWCPNVQGSNGPSLASLYPGDSYVDWIAMDGYSDGTMSFDQVFHWTYSTILNIAPTKPVMIAEVGCAESNYKAMFFTDMLRTQLPDNYGKVRALVYWEGPTGGSGSTTTYLVESDYCALAAFRQGIASSYYSSNVYSSLTSLSTSTIGFS